MYYQRVIHGDIEKWLDKPEVIIIYGARQVGKTTLLKKLIENRNDALLLNCETPSVSQMLETRDTSAINALFSGKKIIGLDEAQSIQEVGKLLKLIYDNMPQFKLIVTGSSSFELAGQLGEPLTGRNIKIRLLPLSLSEISNSKSFSWALENLNTLLVFGAYPGMMDTDDKQRKLSELAGDYLYKDILAFEKVRNPMIIRKLLKALALQVGSEVSVNELSNMLGVSRYVVENYLDVLEKCFILFHLDAYSSKQRNEIRKSKKYYFYDNGILNAVTGNFNPVQNRNDAGSLWENFCISERLKHNLNNNRYTREYFWRTYDGAEIDLVEETSGKLKAFEFKFGLKRKKCIPDSFSSAYNVDELTVITPETIHLLMDL
ncbi:MAG: ATP-binding protein [Bacteroidetes bacterium]|nr:ATP-binding protein [Bacteroidota bacterium]